MRSDRDDPVESGAGRPNATRAKILPRAWDFIRGTLLVGTLPIFALCLVLLVGSLVWQDPGEGWIGKVTQSVLVAGILAVPVATLYFVGRWRKRHRLLPVSVLAIEIVLGLILAGGAFLLTMFLWGMASLE